MSAISQAHLLLSFCFSASVLSGAVYTGSIGRAASLVSYRTSDSGSRHDLHPHASAYRRRPPADKTASSAVLQVLALSDTGAFILLSGMICGYRWDRPLCPGTGEKPDNQKRSCISARFLQLSKPHVLSRLHPRSVSRSSSGRSSSFGNLSSGTFAVMDCRTQIFPHSAFKFRGIGKQRTAAKKQKPGQRSL